MGYRLELSILVHEEQPDCVDLEQAKAVLDQGVEKVGDVVVADKHVGQFDERPDEP
jgi:hypothetical protein